MYDIRNFFAPSIGQPGLSIFVEAGTLEVSGVGTVVPAATVTLPANSTNYVFLNTTSAVVQSNTSGFPSTGYPIATVITGNSGVVSLVDNRPDVTSGGSGGGGGTVTSVGLATGGGAS